MDISERFLDRLATQALRCPPRLAGGFRHAAPVAGPRHAHDAFEIVYHRQGRGIVHLCDGTQKVFAPGALHVTLPGVVHTQHMNTPGEDWCVYVSWPLPAGAAEEAPPCLQIDAMVSEAPLNDLDRLTLPHHDLSAAESAALDLRAGSLLLELLGAAFRSRRGCLTAAADRYAEQAMALMRGHYSELGTAGELAAKVGISPHYLRHVVRRRFGAGPSKLLQRMRVEAAKSLLSHTNLTLVAIAAECGFANERYLSAVFRRFAGVSPGRYRLASQSAADPCSVPGQSR
jgi:AraC-like DNA-binding protein